MNEKKQFAMRLNLALDTAGFDPKGKGRHVAVANQFQVSAESARKWLAGENFPDTKRIPEIARALNVSAQWLLSGEGNMNPRATVKSLPSEDSPFWSKVPALNWEEAGHWETLVPSAKDDDREWAWAETAVGPNAYALTVNDDSMLPRYEEGSILIIDPDYVPTHKHIVIYLLEDERSVTCKQLIIDGKVQYLKPHNPAYPVYQIGPSDRYCGSIRQARMNY